jgi:hypothetical protein
MRVLGFDKPRNLAIEHVDTIETPDGRVALVLERQRAQGTKPPIKTGRIQDASKFKTYKKEELDLHADRKKY